MNKRICAALSAVVFLCSSLCFTAGAENSGEAATEPQNGMTAIAENSNYIMLADMQTARFELYDRLSDQYIASNLTKEQTALDEIAKAKFKRALESQIIITYRDTSLKQEITLGSGTLKSGSEIKTVKAENGFNAEYTFTDIGISLTAEYRIDGEGLTATVRGSSVKETDKDRYLLVSAEILPYFGAAGADENGYIFVPDGCGALIYYNNGKTETEQYSQPVYGNDAAQMRETAPITEETVRLPVFGMKTGNSAFLAVIESGASSSNINASVSGVLNSYNSVCGSYIFRNSDLYSFGNSSSATTYRMYQEKIDTDSYYSVRYLTVTEEPFDYNAMAHTYQRYLEAKLGKNAQGKENGLFLEIYGAVQTQKTFLGLPYRAVTPLTTYSEVVGISDEFKALGADEIIIQYKNWESGNIRNKVPDKVRSAKKLGGSSGLKTMLKKLKTSGTDIYLDLDFTHYTYSGYGYSTRFNSATLLSKTTAIQKKFLLSTLYEDEDAPWSYLLNLKSFKKAVNKYYNSAKQLEADFSLSSLGNDIYTDYFSDDSSRNITEKYFTDAAKTFSNGKGLITSGGNAYMLPFVDFISSAPVTSSGFDVEDETVPFYQLCLSGIKGMSTPPINQDGNPEKAFLKAVETGISPGYLLIKSDSYILKNTAYNNLYGTTFDGWKETAASHLLKWKEIRDKLGNGKIQAHKNINANVTYTLYENGAAVIVNYGDSAYTDENGNVTDAVSYTVLGGDR